MPEAFTFVVRTPHGEVLRSRLVSLRVPTETGSVGILAGMERAAIAIEPGLVVGRTADADVFIATAGGILRVERARATLLAAVAVVGRDPASVVAAMTALTATSTAEAELRRRIDKLEQSLVAQSRRRDGHALARSAGQR